MTVTTRFIIYKGKQDKFSRERDVLNWSKQEPFVRTHVNLFLSDRVDTNPAVLMLAISNLLYDTDNKDAVLYS